MNPESAKEKQRLASWHCDQAIKRITELKQIIAHSAPDTDTQAEEQESDPNQLSIPEFTNQ